MQLHFAEGAILVEYNAGSAPGVVQWGSTRVQT